MTANLAISNSLLTHELTITTYLDHDMILFSTLTAYNIKMVLSSTKNMRCLVCQCEF